MLFGRKSGGTVSTIRRIEGWRAPTSMGIVYETLLAAIGTERFGTTVRNSVQSLTAGARRIYLFEATGREDSSLQYFSGEPGLVELFPAYRRWYVRQDPLGDALCAAPEPGDVALQRVKPADIASPGFRRRFFDDAGIVERISIVQRGRDSWRGINVARHAADGCCSDDELDTLIGLACLALPMLPLNRVQPPVSRRLTVTEVEERFATRHKCLTLRERQVCARAALGMSVEATARDLGVAKTSVLTYRQRAYQRLRVASALELCALVTH
jgi:DNA-binding CsgD family transcriptional regulator